MYRHLRNGQKSLRLLRQNELTRQTRFSSNRQVQRILVLKLNFQLIIFNRHSFKSPLSDYKLAQGQVHTPSENFFRNLN